MTILEKIVKVAKLEEAAENCTDQNCNSIMEILYINLSRVPRPYFNMGVGECVLTDTLTFPLIPNILFYCVQTVFTNR